jgi:hypothetical protein
MIRYSRACGSYQDFLDSGLLLTRDIIYIAEREIKGSGELFFVFLEKPLYEVCLIRIKEQVGEKRSTVCTHRSVENITNMLSIKN